MLRLEQCGVRADLVVCGGGVRVQVGGAAAVGGDGFGQADEEQWGYGAQEHAGRVGV